MVAIFRKTTTKNVALETRVEELERELSVWKSAFKTAEEEKKTLSKSVVSLERKIDSLKVRRILHRHRRRPRTPLFPSRMTTRFTFVSSTGTVPYSPMISGNWGN